MITKIKIKNTATYDNEGITIDNLTKINFFYGANGSGKTTISNIIQSPSEYETCSIEWQDDSPLNVLVYNKKFRDLNFGSTKIAGVFTLGNATKEQIAKIEEKKLRLENIEKLGKQKNATIDKLKNDQKTNYETFKNLCWEQLRLKNDMFKEAFRGFLNDKSKFATKVLEEYNNNTSELLPLNELQKKAKVLFSSEPVLLTVIQIEGLDINIFADIEKDTIWNKKIIGKSDIDIAPLIQKLNNMDWINQGRQYIQEETNICPFCQKETIDNKFRQKIEAFFDENFIRDIEKIKKLLEDYKINCENYISILNRIYDTESKNENTKLNIIFLKSFIDTLDQLFKNNQERFNIKIKEPSRVITINETIEQIKQIQQLINEANNKIAEHNKLVNNFQIERNKLISAVWKYLINDNTTIIEDYLKKDKGLIKGSTKLAKERDKLREEYSKLQLEIKEDNKNVTSVQASVDEINRILSNYGYTNFSIVPTDDNYYQIKRGNGEIAHTTLSEGEVTFITFLYYMQLVHGGKSPETANENKILVIDDPISSLDETILFVVSSLIKEEIKAIKKGISNVKQLLLLTHNIYFHKEVSFIDGRTKETGDTYYWILRKNNNISNIQCFEMTNPIRGSYELLWDELKNRLNLSNITIQNTMRRIYETYFKILGKYSDDEILNKFENPQDKEICRSLLCWVNDGSHCIPDDLHIGLQVENKERYFIVFQKIFKEMGHIEHYNMMMGIKH
ncbi:MAG: AAA family ATPase [Muribaculaceae bacterium]|nr:AAA family ATPase [Muribaculaceae bacterium]